MDVYNPSAPNNGNTNVGTIDKRQLDWLHGTDKYIDLRLFFFDKEPSFWRDCSFSNWKSSTTGTSICYTTESLKYAQSSYFFGLILLQALGVYLARTRIQSTFTRKPNNVPLLVGMVWYLVFLYFVFFSNGMNEWLGTRNINDIQFIWPSLMFFVIILAFEEWRKWLFRRRIDWEKGEMKINGLYY